MSADVFLRSVVDGQSDPKLYLPQADPPPAPPVVGRYPPQRSGGMRGTGRSSR